MPVDSVVIEPWWVVKVSLITDEDVKVSEATTISVSGGQWGHGHIALVTKEKANFSRPT